MRNSLLLLVVLCALAVLPIGSMPASAQAPVPAGVSPADAHTALKRVLSRGEFQDYNKMELGWWKKATRAIGNGFRSVMKPIENFFKGIGRLFSRLRPARQSSNPAAEARNMTWRYLLYAIIIMAVLFLLGLLISRIISAQRLRKATEDLDAVEDDLPQRRKQEPSYWERSLEQAEMLWDAGNQRDALRILYRACLVLLDARGILRYEESRANGEVLRELRRQGKADVHQMLRPIVGCFDRSWYGFLTIPSDEFQSVVASSREFRKAVVDGSHA